MLKRLAAVIGLFAACNASAEVFEYNFTATIISITDIARNGAFTSGGPTSALGSNVELGDLITGNFIYDSTTPFSSSMHSTRPGSVSRYSGAASSNRIAFEIVSNGFQFRSALSAYLDVSDNSIIGFDSFGIYTIGSTDPTLNYSYQNACLQFSDPTGNAVNNSTLPSELPLLFFATIPRLSYTGFLRADGSSVSISADLNSITSVPGSTVPEPMSIALLGAGLLSLAASQRKAAKK